MLDCLIKALPQGNRLISIQPTMSQVANGTPVDENCLFDMDACYETFDKDGDGKLNLDEFRLICKALFRNDKGHIYPLPEERARHIFAVFDKNGDGYIDKEEFTFCWNHWIKVIVRPVSAFLIVDVQNDFISGTLNISKCNAQQDGSEVVGSDWGSTTSLSISAVKQQCRTAAFRSEGQESQSDYWHRRHTISGLRVVEPINRLLEAVPFDSVFYSLDWHPPDHVSFIDNVHMRELHPSSPVVGPCEGPTAVKQQCRTAVFRSEGQESQSDYWHRRHTNSGLWVSADKAQAYDTVVFAGPPPMKQRLWPRHCVQDSWGAELHKDLKIVEGAVKVYKGTNPEVDSYSVFWDNKKLTDTSLSTQLRMRGATDIYICGLAYDVCVGATIADALAIGYRAILIDDASRGVDLADIEKTKATIVGHNGVIINAEEVLAMVEGRDRRPELGYKLAMELKNAMEDAH